MSEDCLCDRCTALCCRYFALGIDDPETSEDYDDIRWYLAHENVHVFIEDDEWYLSIQTRCRNLQDDNKCGIYEDRPKICREYSTDNCDYYTGSYDFDQYFTTPEQLEAYAQAVLGDRYKRYVMSQRLKNVGMAKDHPEKPSGKQVLAARIRSSVKGHPSRHPKRRHNAPSGQPAPLVAISINTPKR